MLATGRSLEAILLHPSGIRLKNQLAAGAYDARGRTVVVVQSERWREGQMRGILQTVASSGPRTQRASTSVAPPPVLPYRMGCDAEKALTARDPWGAGAPGNGHRGGGVYAI